MLEKYLNLIKKNKNLKQEIDNFLLENGLNFINYKIENGFIKLNYNASFKFKVLSKKEELESFLQEKELKIKGLL